MPYNTWNNKKYVDGGISGGVPNKFEDSYKILLDLNELDKFTQKDIKNTKNLQRIIINKNYPINYPLEYWPADLD